MVAPMIPAALAAAAKAGPTAAKVSQAAQSAQSADSVAKIADSIPKPESGPAKLEAKASPIKELTGGGKPPGPSPSQGPSLEVVGKSVEGLSGPQSQAKSPAPESGSAKPEAKASPIKELTGGGKPPAPSPSQGPSLEVVGKSVEGLSGPQSQAKSPAPESGSAKPEAKASPIKELTGGGKPPAPSPSQGLSSKVPSLEAVGKSFEGLSGAKSQAKSSASSPAPLNFSQLFKPGGGSLKELTALAKGQVSEVKDQVSAVKSDLREAKKEIKFK